MRDWLGKIVATVEVSASETRGANVIGGVEIKRALDSLRLAVRREFIRRVSDSLFLWELDKSLVIAKEGKEQGYQFGLFINREVYPFIADISPAFERILDSKSIWSQIITAILPEDIQRRVDRAVEWISLAITESSIDHKLVHLCTALEVLLLPDHNLGTKGEIIAFRQVLTGRSTYENPTAILNLYEQRGDIIHSGYLDITTPYEYWYLLSCCLNVLRNIVQLSQENQQVFELKALLAIVENEESLGEFIEDCEKGFHEGKGIKKIMEAAKERLERLKKENA